jgi:formylglycine-generating enzyme required for sulfatase activity
MLGPAGEGPFRCENAQLNALSIQRADEKRSFGTPSRNGINSHRSTLRHVQWHGMAMRFLTWLCFSLALVMLAVPASGQQRRNQVALLIANANYPDSNTPLPTTIKDGRSLADEFRRHDFEVDLKENVGKEDMQRAIDAFVNKISNGTVAVFFFSGFGIQVERQTYLIPTNGQVWTEADTKRDGIRLEGILADMQRRGARVKIVIIDASRRNPFERRFRPSSAGLAALDAPENTLAIYSAAPGTVMNDKPGDNSLFVGEMIKEMRAPNLTAEEIFNRTRIGVSRASNNEQVPWVASSLIEEYKFSGATRSPAPAAPEIANARPAPISGNTAAEHKVGETFRDCAECPEMVVVPAGAFEMGSPAPYERPVHRVMIAKAFAIGRYEVTFDEWGHCVADKRCKYTPDDRGWGKGNRPVINLSWVDAKDFVAWLSEKSGKTYRLPSEAEWEYAARGGTKTKFWWGRDIGDHHANCQGCNTGSAAETLPVGSFKPNPYGVYDTSGNVAEWVEDCWHDSYRGAPPNGAAWTNGQCELRVLRGGAFDSQPGLVASAARFRYDYDVRYPANGFRVVRELQ